jgi:hypothetical protein
VAPRRRCLDSSDRRRLGRGEGGGFERGRERLRAAAQCAHEYMVRCDEKISNRETNSSTCVMYSLGLRGSQASMLHVQIATAGTVEYIDLGASCGHINRANSIALYVNIRCILAIRKQTRNGNGTLICAMHEAATRPFVLSFDAKTSR